MQQKEILEEIAGKLEKKYTGFVEIYRLTKELDDLLKNNDRGSVNMVMKMRGEEMDKINTLDEDINRACDLIGAKYRKYINKYNDFDSFPEDLERIISIKKSGSLCGDCRFSVPWKPFQYLWLEMRRKPR